VGNGYVVPAADAMDELRQILQDARRRLRELEALDGSQIYNTVQDLRNLIDGLLEQVDGNFTGTLTVGGLSTLDEINSLATYDRLVTGSGAFRTMSVNILGHIGQTVSSRRFKQDIQSADIPGETLRALRVVFFRYSAQMPFDQEQQPWLLGLIAEEVHELGLTWLVVYDEEGRPQALVDFALPYLGLLLAQYNAEEIDALRAEIRSAQGLKNG
jgi:hypothetical protein